MENKQNFSGPVEVWIAISNILETGDNDFCNKLVRWFVESYVGLNRSVSDALFEKFITSLPKEMRRNQSLHSFGQPPNK